MKSLHANPPEKICRLCLSDSGVILPIFEGEIAERFSVSLPQKILSCLAIKVCADDPLPPHICHRCLYEVDRFHEFRETCKRTNTTFNKICNNSGESVPFDVNQVLEIKQELHDESVYHDAITELLSEEEGSEVGASRIRKRNRCLSLLESMKRVQQAQSATSVPAASSEEIPTVWIEQVKTTPTANSSATPTHIQPELECRFCSKPFIYESTLLEHEELHAKGLVGDDSIEQSEQPVEVVHDSLHSSILDSETGANSMQVVQEAQEANSSLNESDTSHPSHNQDPETGTSVETVSLTDVTAMLLEGAFEGGRLISNEASTLCRHCQEQFSNPDLLRRHERLYCNRKPLMMKQKETIHQHQIQQHPQDSHQPPMEAILPADQTNPQDSQQQPANTHHLVVQQQVNPQLQHPEQQIAFEQKDTEENKAIEASRSCKHCNKNFIHRGSLWRHQMFCDSNPDRDVNRIVAVTKKKSSVLKNCDFGNNSREPLSHSGMAVVNTVPEPTAGPELRRGGMQTTSGPFKCKFCEKRFLHRGSWWRHQKMFCSVNPEIPVVKAAAKVSNQQGVSSFACRYCERTFVHRGSCWHHEQTHTGSKEHACRYCSKTFNEKSRVARHERMHLGIKPFSCRQCGKSFCDASNLRNHEQIHGDRTSFLCPWCGKSYTRRALLLKHEQVHAGEGQVYPCVSCPRTFPDPDMLNEHAMSHNQERKRIFLCQTCGQNFRSQSLLSEHNHQTHLNVADQHSSQPQQVQHHIQQSSSQTLQEQEHHHLSCSICSKVFSDISSLRHHEQLHNTTSRQYRCSNTACNAVFHQRSQLDDHLLMHEDEKSHTIQSSVTSAGTTTVFHQQHQSQHSQQILATHEIQHQQPLQHHEILHRDGTYVIEGQDVSGQTIAVHHLVTGLP